MTGTKDMTGTCKNIPMDDDLNTIKVKLEHINNIISQIQRNHDDGYQLYIDFTCMVMDYIDQIENDIEDIKAKYLF